MKKNTFSEHSRTILFSIFISFVCMFPMIDSFSQCGWTAKNNFGGAARRNAVGFSIGTKGYIGTGYTGSSNTYYKDFWEWDQGTNVWTQKADFGGTTRYAAVGFSIGTKGYIGTGLDNTSTPKQDFWEWNQSNNTWTVKANFGGGVRYWAVGFSVGAKGYIGTGYDNSTSKNDFWEYDPAGDTWTAKTNFGGTARYQAVGFSIGTKGYIGTGYDGNDKQDFWEWNQSNNSWTQKANFGGTARVEAVGFSIGTRGYIGTGNDNVTGTVNDFWEWNQATNAWSQKSNVSGSNRWNAVGFSIGTKGYIGTGNLSGPTYYQDFWEYYKPAVDIISTQSVSCSSGANGSASVTASGSSSPYTYVWSNGQSAQSATGLSANTYTATVTDVNNCVVTATVAITQPLSLKCAITYTSAVSCYGGNNGAATATGIDGTPPYTYSWNNGQTTSAATNLTAGNYTVTVTDANGCTTPSLSTTIAQPASALSASITVQSNVSCHGGNDGGAVGSASGGTSPYTYLWSNGSSASFQNNLFAGNYTLTITDSHNCAATTTTSITQPLTLTSTISFQANVSCYGGNNGSATVAVGGGTLPYTYQWSNSQSTSAITGLIAGGYNVTIFDSHGCSSSNTLTITQPAAALTNSGGITNATCFGGNNGTASDTAHGGTPPYTFLWMPSGQTTAQVTNLSAQITYSLTVTDNNGCTSTATVTVSQPPAITITISSQQDASCNGKSDGFAFVTAVGGTGTLGYLWSTGSTANGITNKPAGNYSVTVTDANSCTATKTVSISQPAVLTPTITLVSNATCGNGDGAATANASGGTSPFTFLWSNSENIPNPNNFGAGSYSVLITDANNCTASASVTIGNNPPPAPNICVVTVDSLSKNNVIVWDKAQTNQGDTIFVYRDTANNKYGIIGKVPFDSLSWYIDTVRTLYAANGNPNVSTWRYKIAVQDSCGNMSVKSPYHQSLYIQNSSGNFSWNHYQIEGQTVPVPSLNNYIFERDNISNGNWQTIQTLSASSLAYTDPQYATYQTTGSWRVQTAWTTSCTASIKNPNTMAVNLNSSKSNAYRTANPTSVKNNSSENIITIYPNPSSGIFTIDISKINSSQVIVSVFNMMGEEVEKINYSNGTNRLTLNLTRHTKGVYYIQISSEQNLITKKVIIE